MNPAIGDSPNQRERWLLFGLALIFSALFATSAAASTLLNPEPEDSSTLFGRSVAVVGDLNGDGVPDLAVGAPFQDGDIDDPDPGFGPPQNVGKVFLISGSDLSVIRILDDPKFQVIEALKFGGQFGSSVAAAGDVNRDGISDILVGVPHHVVEGGDENEVNAGRAFVFSGRDGSILLTLDDPDSQENARLGFAAVNLGDVNGDQVPDLLVGEPKRDSDAGLADVGLAYIFSGANGTVLRTLAPPALGGAEANGRFGSAVANAGDVDQDGVSDALIGSPGNGRAYVLSGATGAVLRTIISPTLDRLPSFGIAVAGGKDVNGDGIPDFAIGAPLQKLLGIAYVFNGADGTLLRRLRPAPESLAKLGASIALIDDVTGDGRPDVLVGSPDHTVNGLANAGEALIFNGGTGGLFKTITSAQPKAYAGFGYALTAADFGTGVIQTVSGTPFQDAEIFNPDDGDFDTHLQIGQIEIQ